MESAWDEWGLAQASAAPEVGDIRDDGRGPETYQLATGATTPNSLVGSTGQPDPVRAWLQSEEHGQSPGFAGRTEEVVGFSLHDPSVAAPELLGASSAHADTTQVGAMPSPMAVV